MGGFDMESLVDATAGAIGSLASTTILYPLDTCKTKYQAELRSPNLRKYRNLSDVLWEAISKRQVLSLFQGLGTKNLQSFISSFIYFYGYSFFRKMYIERSGYRSIGTKANLFIAAVAGACTVAITQPLDTAASRMQTSDFGKSKGLWKTLSEETWEEAFDGLGISILLTINPAIQYTAFDQLKQRLLDGQQGNPQSLSALTAFLLGAASKCAATCLTYPAIRCKVMIQAAESEEDTYEESESRKTSDHSINLCVKLNPNFAATHQACRVRKVTASSRIDMEISGLDSNGRQFKNADEMWREEVGDSQKKLNWYRNGVGYWQGVEASVDGVLGGYGHVNEPDINSSEAFLNTLLADFFPDSGTNQHLVALDCGSGIGRVTKNLLIRYFNEVDLLEPVSHFLEAARENLAAENLLVSEDHKAVNFYCTPLQEFTPDAGRYDVIWIQWCIGHLADDDFVSFFKRAKGGLKPGGFFILKENLARSGFVLDNEDKSLTRSHTYFKELFNRCGLGIYRMKDQKGFPNELFPVRMYALTTETPKRVGPSKPKRQLNRPAIIK
ncbi:hypothetical protein E3N88_05657 [Mikania micrantha]|uniref:Methyltransferase domain-containing protein n=1 Tax=Mikania micrantha TaxID=192012 RepID=A0A5N6PMC6_9ASTR|nr:hypothetical protein E3N88_05657 [Mikania micrantha]